MKTLLLLFASLFSIITCVQAQQDTVYIDQNDSVYSILPLGYQVVDTTEAVSEQISFITGDTQCGGGSGVIIGQLPDSSFYIFWKVEIKNNGLLGTYYFEHDQILLDSITVNATSPVTQYTDTFKINADSVKTYWNCDAIGTDSIKVTSSTYFTRIEIKIVPIVTGGVEIGKDDDQIIKVYPNPSSSSLTLSGVDNKKGHLIQIYNLAGKLVKREPVSNEPFYIGDLNNGLYFLRIEDTVISFIKK